MLLAVRTDVATHQVTSPAALWLVLSAAGLAAVLAVVLGRVGHSARTIHHEAGHALVGALLGATVLSLRAHRRGGGVTRFLGLTWGIDLLVSLAGYLAPSAFGVLSAVLVRADQPRAALVVTMVLLGLVLLIASGVYTFAVVIGLGACLFLVVRYTGDGTQMLAGLTWSWFLLIGGVVDAIGLTQVRRQMRSMGVRDTDTDAASLRRLTFVPAGLWVGVFLLGSIVALITGGSLLLGIPL